MNNDNEKKIHQEEQSGAVVPLQPASVAKPDPLLEELQVVRLEGRYFCFDKHEAKQRKGVFRYRDGKRGLLIEVSPRFGHPSIIAYKVLQAVFRKVTLEGKPYPDTVAFSYRELARMVGRDIFGGQDSRQLYLAIRQLEDTKVELYLYDERGKEFQSYRFSLIVGSGFIGEGDVANPARLKAAVLTLHPVIMDNMRRGHFAIFNWERISELEPLTAALYKRLYLHLSNLYEVEYGHKTLKFEKDYAAVCAEWLGGLKPERYKSRIQQQLGAHFEALHKAGVVRSVSIEKMADGQGFKLVFRPGQGFFSDYEHFYLSGKARVLQFQQAADGFHIKGPIELVAYFYKRLHKVDKLDVKIFSEKDAEFAKRLLDQLGEDGVRDLIDFALEEAPKTRFDMKNVRAIASYLPAWQAGRVQRTKRLEAERLEAKRRRDEQLHHEYDDFCQKTIFDYLERLPHEEREAIRKLAASKIAEKYSAGSVIRKSPASVRFEERTIVKERAELPSFDEWLASRK